VEPSGGFYITIPVVGSEEKIAAALLENSGILVHPGYFYDIDPNHLVMSFIHDPDSITKHFEQIREQCTPEGYLHAFSVL
jgi:aspartate/methionine/tyrosine aminotransferase